MNEKNTRNALKVSAMNMVTMLNEFITMIDDESFDLVDIGFQIDKMEMRFDLKETLENCDEY